MAYTNLQIMERTSLGGGGNSCIAGIVDPMAHRMITRRESLQLLGPVSGSALAAPLWATGHTSDSSSAPPSAGLPVEGRDSKPTEGIAPVFTWLTLGEVKPAGWIKEQMARDLNHGFAGHLDELCREASCASILIAMVRVWAQAEVRRRRRRSVASVRQAGRVASG